MRTYIHSLIKMNDSIDDEQLNFIHVSKLLKIEIKNSVTLF